MCWKCEERAVRAANSEAQRKGLRRARDWLRRAKIWLRRAKFLPKSENPKISLQILIFPYRLLLVPQPPCWATLRFSRVQRAVLCGAGVGVGGEGELGLRTSCVPGPPRPCLAVRVCHTAFAGRRTVFLRTHLAYVTTAQFFLTLEPQKSGVQVSLRAILGSFDLSEP